MLPCRTYRNDIEFSVLVRSPSQVNSLSFHLVQKNQSRHYKHSVNSRLVAFWDSVAYGVMY